MARSPFTAARLVCFGLLIAALALTYAKLGASTRDHLLKKLAQDVIDLAMNARVERLDGISLSPEGSLVLLRPRLVTDHRDGDVPFFEAESIRFQINADVATLFQKPVDELRLVRIDVESPHMYIARGRDDVWNIDQAFRPRPPPPAPRETPTPAPPPPTPAAAPSAAPPADPFPSDGIHIHNGTLHLQFHSPAKTLDWTMEKLFFTVKKPSSGNVVLHNIDGDQGIRGTFYGGTITTWIDLFGLSQGLEWDLRIKATDARLEQITEGLHLPRPVRGRVSAYFTLTRSVTETEGRNIAHCTVDVVDGDLYEYPMVLRAVSILNLNVPHDARIDTASVAFTVHRHTIDIKRVAFLCDAMSLTGAGVADLFGQDVDIVLVPQFGRPGNLNPLNFLLGNFLTAHLRGPIVGLQADVVPFADYGDSRKRIVEDAVRREGK